MRAVSSPLSRLRAAVTPAGRGRGSKAQSEEGADKPGTPRHVAMGWAQRLKRVFGVEIEACARCGGKLKVIASIEEPAVIAKTWRTWSARPRTRISPSCRSEPGRHRRSADCFGFDRVFAAVG